MKRVLLAVAALLLAILGLAFTAGSASAHTPAITADCSGVHLDATSYEAGRANTWTVTIDGATQSGTFDTSFSQTFPVPQAGATTSWSARIASYDGAYDSGVQSGDVGPCGQADTCADLPGDQLPGTDCTPPPTVVRSDAHSAHGCDVVFQGHEYGAGDLTYDEVFDDSYVFDANTNGWDLVTDTTGDVKNVQFTHWTKADQVRAGCIDKPGDDTVVAGVQATPLPHATSTSTVVPQVPTVIDAGLSGATVGDGTVASGDPSFVSLATVLGGAGIALILGAAFARRRTAR